MKRRLTAEERWCAERRREVKAYLKRERVEHGRVGSWPAWHVVPYLSLWAIESRVRPGWVGWWAICGDIPTDYLSSRRAKHPRTALRAFGKRWLAIARSMERGRARRSVQIGTPSDWPALVPLLRTRARLLVRLANAGRLWA